MIVEQEITRIVTDSMQPELFRIENESHRHSVPVNSETHFKLVVVSDIFDGLSRVKRHQHIYQLLQQQLAGPVHALALHLYTPAEWQQRQQDVPASPDCRGGSTKQV